MADKPQHPNSRANLQAPWSSTNQPKNPGRKPSKLKKYIKDNNIGADDVAAMAKFILPMTQEEIVKLMNDPKVPMVMKVLAKGVLADMKGSHYKNLLALFDRAVGKPKEKIDISADFGNKPSFKIVDKDGNEILPNAGEEE